MEVQQERWLSSWEGLLRAFEGQTVREIGRARGSLVFAHKTSGERRPGMDDETALAWHQSSAVSLGYQIVPPAVLWQCSHMS